jgi:tetratricopeptide (TPR) repeat protein
MLARMATNPRGAALSEMLGAAALGAADATLATLLGPLGRGRYLLDEGQLDAAVAELEKLPGERAATLLGQALLGVGAARAEDSVWADSVTAFRRAADLGADLAAHAAVARQATLRRVGQLNDSAHGSGGDRAGADGRWEAVELMEAMHPLLPRDTAFDADLGASYAQLARQVNNDDDFEQAVVLLRKALVLTPDDPNTRHFAKIALGNLAHQLLLGGDGSGIRRAFALLREAPAFAEDQGDAGRLRAQAADALFGAARSHADANRLDTAVTVLREALTYVDDSVTRRFLASLYHRLDRPGEAVTVLAEGYARLPGDPELAGALATAVHNEAIRLADSRRFDEAIAAFHRALGISDSPVTRKMLAQTYALRGMDRVNAGDRHNGLGDLQRAVQLDPSDPALYRALRTVAP